MGRLLLFDPSRGAAGDMVVSALAQLCNGERLLRERMRKAGFRQTLSFKAVNRGHAKCLLLEVKGPDERLQPDAMKKRLAVAAKKAGLSRDAQEFCARALRLLVEGERKAHGIREVHFHELASIDTAIDIFSAAVLLGKLGAFDDVEVRCLPIGVGAGVGPAALSILESARLPVIFLGEAHELCTPTGAAILAAAAKNIDGAGELFVKRLGYGAGLANPEGHSNYLRAALAETAAKGRFLSIEANVDDMTGEALAFAVDELMGSGARDACLIPVIAKKGRPGFIIRALCDEASLDAVLDAFFRQTTTWGVRITNVEKRAVERKVGKVETRYGTVRIKESAQKWKPEFDDVARIAHERKIPLAKVVDEVRNIKYGRAKAARKGK